MVSDAAVHGIQGHQSGHPAPSAAIIPYAGSVGNWRGRPRGESSMPVVTAWCFVEHESSRPTWMRCNLLHLILLLFTHGPTSENSSALVLLGQVLQPGLQCSQILRHGDKHMPRARQELDLIVLVAGGL